MMEEKITVKDILKDNYNDLENEYWYKVPKDMRKHIDEVVSKALKCSDIKYWYNKKKGSNYEVGVIAVIHILG
jgi:hypothetical protein